VALFDLSTQSTTADPVGQMLKRLCATLELDHAAYAGISTFDQSVHAIATYPEGWKQHYLTHSLHLQDPTLRFAVRSVAPVHWDRLRQVQGFRRVFGQARDFNIPDQGVTIPVRGRFGDIGMLSVARDCSVAEWEKLGARVMEALQTNAALIHDTVMRDAHVFRATHVPNLSAREIEVLQWTAAGKSQEDVADILTLSIRTVEVHLRSARAKLGALNTAQAVARAVGMGVIYPL
jgi:DNA-binding CsgD family transcriptional regulator